MKRILLTLVVALLRMTQFARAQLGEGGIQDILRTRIDAERRGLGIVVGSVDKDGSRIVSYGDRGGGAGEVGADTVFEIGSVTKVLTALLLAEMANLGEVSLDDAVAKYLPPSVTMPLRAGRQITLRDLASQRSGLPRLPGNLAPNDAANPYADYTIAQLYEFLSGYQLTRDIGSKYEYSNLGFGLLGHALALKAGMDYEALVVDRICSPLGMQDTRIALSSSLRERLARGHDESLAEVKNWDLPALAGRGRAALDRGRSMQIPGSKPRLA